MVVSEWLPIKTVPPDEPVMFWHPQEFERPVYGWHDSATGDYWFIDIWWDKFACGLNWDYSTADEPLTPTHWAPIPEPPL